MKLKDIKTEKQFYEIAENWYQRVHRLREVWQNPKEEEKRQEKAHKLWFIMFNRVMKLVPKAIEISKRQQTNKFEKGGDNFV